MQITHEKIEEIKKKWTEQRFQLISLTIYSHNEHIITRKKLISRDK